jgi:hypothetical protein
MTFALPRRFSRGKMIGYFFYSFVRRRVRAVTPMTVVQLPRLSDQASKLWNAIPTDAKKKLLANVFCGHCRGAVSIVNVTGTVKGGDLVLNGNCAVCGHDVARHVESSSS